MTIKSENFYLVLLAASVFSSFVFCVGFFPYSNVLKSPSHLSDSELQKLNLPTTNRSILMLIDALRLDMLAERSNFPFVHETLARGDGCMLQLKVNLPTVTKPRITAMTSGTVPSFLDVAKNFAKNQIKLDTFLHQLHARKHKIVFAGDDTWLMFPFFTRAYANRDSLFVNDFYEGDRNITATLAHELKQSDWRLLILHFLGLDHIGHVFNPFDELVPPKLREMDEVVRRIVQKLAEWNARSRDKSLLVLTSDHGMRDAGGHSGNSFPETHIPLLILGRNCTSNDRVFYNQIDLATTLSIMNGVPIPESSIGTVIPELLFDLDPLRLLSVVKIVNERLLRMIDFDKSEEFYLKHKKASSHFETVAANAQKLDRSAWDSALRLFGESSREISERLAQQSLEVNLFYVLLGLGMNLLVAATVLVPCDAFKVKELRVEPKRFVPVIAAMVALKLLVFDEAFAQRTDAKSLLVVTAMAALLRLVGDILRLKLARRRLQLFDNDLLYLLLLGHGFFAASVASSSFIEEEHQVWYYLCSALLLALAFFEFRARRSCEALVQSAPVLCLHVLVRRLNQTGDKWINAPDLGDWLHRRGNDDWLRGAVIVSLLASLGWLTARFVRRRVELLPFLVLAHVALYMHHTREQHAVDVGNATLFWVGVVGIFAVAAVNRWRHRSHAARTGSTLLLVFVLVSMLLHRPHNVGLCFAVGVTSALVNRAAHRMVKGTHERIVAKVIMHWWLGKLFYFYQGNSNSLSTIDTNAGFVGQSHAHLPVIFVFSTINTFNAQILSMMLLVVSLVEDSKRLMLESSTVMLLLTKWIAFLTIIPTTSFLVIITLLRHHLFIWSVFSPKLLYDFCINVLVLCAMLVVRFLVKF